MLMSNGEELETELSSWIFVEDTAEPETCEINLFFGISPLQKIMRHILTMI